MLTKTFKMTDPQGLHARPASAIVKVAKGFSSEITLVAEDRVSLKNLMKVLSQGIAPNTTFSIEISGEDEAVAMQTITDALRTEGMAEEA
ncbi:phosphocarrier protein HPr [Deinococcus xinjiangensis]|uniref:Phosphocarrier protein HPr n=1 Tax=Deinococcus xinjiangensis TaxID=457454 RepID=A0ABP9VGA0_9DEIO